MNKEKNGNILDQRFLIWPLPLFWFSLSLLLWCYEMSHGGAHMASWWHLKPSIQQAYQSALKERFQLQWILIMEPWPKAGLPPHEEPWGKDIQGNQHWITDLWKLWANIFLLINVINVDKLVTIVNLVYSLDSHK